MAEDQQGFVIENAVLLDVASGERRPRASVRVEGPRIAAVASNGERLDAPGLRRFDAGGRTLMPGLIDAHVHCAISRMNIGEMASHPATLRALEAKVILEGMLRRGFTTVRDLAGADRGLATALERGLIRGPRLFRAGRAISQTGGHGDFQRSLDAGRTCACEIRSDYFAHIADGPDAVRRAAREELKDGVHNLKIMASGGVASPTDPVNNLQYSPEEMRVAVAEAASWHTYVAAHAYTPEAIRRAVEAGVRTIEHGNLLDEAVAALMAERGAFLVPTLVTYEAIVEHGPALGFPEVSLRKVHDVIGAGLESLAIARHAGVRLGFGTDLLGETHRYQSREFSIRAQAEAPIDVIRSATLINAEILGKTGELGVIAPGARADLLLVDGDPLEDVGVIAGEGEELSLIARDGEIVHESLG